MRGLLLLLAGLSSVVNAQSSGRNVPGTSRAQARLAFRTDSLLRAHAFSGVAYVSRHGRVLFHRAYGEASREYHVANQRTTRFRIASITKLFTAALVAKLVEQGQLQYDATISRYLPGYIGDAAKQVTLEQLLTHTSGLANPDDVGTFEEAVARGLPQYQLPASSAEMVQRYASGQLVHAPGTTFDYNNADYFVLGRVVEAVTGQSYAAALKERLLDPLGLTSTGVMDWRAITPVVATGYLRPEKGAPYIHELPAYFENWGAAGALYSTAADLAHFADQLFDGAVLRPETLTRLLTARMEEYAHGLWVAPVVVRGKPDRVAHRPGQIMGANTTLLRYLGDGLTVVVLANTNSAPMDAMTFAVARGYLLHRGP